MTVQQLRTPAFDGIDAGVTLHLPNGTPRSCVLYLHGGGLLYGERDDLPARYIEMLLARGHMLVCADYPLAPETPLRGIHAFVDALWEWCAGELAPAHGAERVFLFGRSAGAYLALTLAGRLTERAQAAQPSGVIDLYGYDNTSLDAIAAPSEHYLKFPVVGRSVAEGLVSPAPVTSAPISARYALYVHARQQGCWDELLATSASESAAYAISDERAAKMPPVFYAASTADQDIPYSVSKQLARRLRAKMVTVYGLEHDFDRNSDEAASVDVYEKMLGWMDGVLAP